MLHYLNSLIYLFRVLKDLMIQKDLIVQWGTVGKVLGRNLGGRTNSVSSYRGNLRCAASSPCGAD